MSEDSKDAASPKAIENTRRGGPDTVRSYRRAARASGPSNFPGATESRHFAKTPPTLLEV